MRAEARDRSVTPVLRLGLAYVARVAGLRGRGQGSEPPQRAHTARRGPRQGARLGRGFAAFSIFLLEHFHYFYGVSFVVSHPFHKEREKDGARGFLTPSVKMP